MNRSVTVISRLAVRIIVMLLLLKSASPASAQTGGPYQLTWSTIDGGGGTSSGGPYTLSGTAGH